MTGLSDALRALPTGDPSTCELLPEDCRLCACSCPAAGDVNDDPPDGPEVYVQHATDWEHPWGTHRRV